MREAEERLAEDVLFLACTRPAMFLGAPMEAMGINIILTAIAFLGGHSLLYLLIAPALHLVFQAICKSDRDDFYPTGPFRSDFARGLDTAYRARVGAEQMFVNELYVTLVLHPGRDAGERAQALVSRFGGRFGGEPADGASEAETEGVKLLEDAGRDLAQYLARYGATPLGLAQRTALYFSEPL